MSPHETREQRWARRGREAWPTVKVPAELFGAFVRERLKGRSEESLPLEALYLTCACARGDSLAIAAFEQAYFRPAVLRLKELTDELVAALREKLFVAAPGGSPRIAEYAGRGPLETWLRLVALRTQLNLQRTRKRRREDPLELGGLELRDGRLDPEQAVLRRDRRSELGVAFVAALRRLEPDERRLLRQRYLEQLGEAELAELWKVHRVTVARWLAKAKEKLRARTLEALEEKLGETGSERKRLLQSAALELELSLGQLLQTLPHPR